MDTLEEWRPVVNGVLYSLQFREQLDNELAAHMAQRLIREPLAGLTAEQQHEALTAAVETGIELTRRHPEHPEDEVRRFLVDVLAEMDALRPWPEPPFEQIRLYRWADYSDEPVLIARLRISSAKTEHLVGVVLGNLSDIAKDGAFLRLKSGTVIALVARWWPDSNNVAVLTQGPCENPAAVVQELIESTELDTNRVEEIA